MISASVPYFGSHSHFWILSGGFHCGSRRNLPTFAVSSCMAPNGHSQPQNTPRPMTIRENSA
jgi:hypothetical protein